MVTDRGTVSAAGRGGRGRRPARPARPLPRRPGAHRPAADGRPPSRCGPVGCPARSTAGGATTMRSRMPTGGCSAAAGATCFEADEWTPRRRTVRARPGLHRRPRRPVGRRAGRDHPPLGGLGGFHGRCDGRALCTRVDDGVVAIGGYNGTGNLVGPVAARAAVALLLDGTPAAGCFAGLSSPQDFQRSGGQHAQSTRSGRPARCGDASAPGVRRARAERGPARPPSPPAAPPCRRPAAARTAAAASVHAGHAADAHQRARSPWRPTRPPTGRGSSTTSPATARASSRRSLSPSAKQLGFPRGQGEVGGRVVQQRDRPDAEEVRLRHQRGLDHRRSAPRSSTSPAATTTSRRRSSR